MTEAEQPEALRLADRLQNAVATYPQVGEDEPGGYCQEVDQVMDEAAAELRRQHARIADLEAQLSAIGAGGVEPLRSRQCLHKISEPIRWPKDAKEVREFFSSDFIRAEFVSDDHEPCDEDRYLISAHDFLSAVNWWADFPHIPPSPSSADEGGSNG